MDDAEREASSAGGEMIATEGRQVRPARGRPPSNTQEARNAVEALLLCAGAPVTVKQIVKQMREAIGADTVKLILEQLAKEWEGRGLRLVCMASGWCFITAPEVIDVVKGLEVEAEPRKYSRATMETLAVIAYRQPVTRGDIEAIRGVSDCRGPVMALEERGWIEIVGNRETVGRPSLLATTKKFLDDLGLRSLSDLPELPPGRPIEDEKQ
jgi:segregation and condensation protein B